MGPFLTPQAHDCGDGMFCLLAGSAAEAEAIAAANPFHRRGIRTYTASGFCSARPACVAPCLPASAPHAQRMRTACALPAGAARGLMRLPPAPTTRLQVRPWLEKILS